MAEQVDCCSGGNQQSKPGSKAASARAFEATGANQTQQVRVQVIPEAPTVFY